MQATLRKIVIVGLVLSVRSTVALAAEDPEALIRQGVELRKAGEDARAEGYFRRAYQLAATPRTAAQLGLVELALSDYIHAEEHLSEALAHQDAWIREHLAALTESRATARRNLFHVELVGAPPNATVALDGTPSRPLPPDNTIWLDPGRPATIRIEAPGSRPAVLQVTGAAGEGRRMNVEMQSLEQTSVAGAGSASPPAVVDRSSTEGSPGRTLQIAGIATAAAGVVAGVVGIVFYEQGQSKLHDYQNAIKTNAPWNPQDEDWESTRNTGVALLVAGGVAVVGGAGLFLLGNHQREAAEKVSFTAAPGLAFFSYRRSF
jgi:hypothetical protein